MSIQPFIVGGGRSGLAIAKALASLNVLHPDLGLQPAQVLKRGTALSTVISSVTAPDLNSLLIVANPHGLHARTLIEADRAGFKAIACEKPVCVNRDEIEALSKVKSKTAVFHVYRQTWGAQSLKAMIDGGELGEIITIEGRYWQSSTADRALNPLSESDKAKNWKNNPALSGASDTLIDVGVHWIDFARYLFGAKITKSEIWKSYVNAESAHRDSHIQVALGFANGGRAMASVSKAFHGATNHFEVNVIGAQGSASWNFLNPDEIMVGRGRDRSIVTRKSAELGSMQPAFHATGWLEGYMEISLQLIRDAFLGEPSHYPNLAESLELMSAILD